MKVPTDDYTPEGDKNCLNSELWHACAGPLVYLPCIGSHVVYFPQGHSEQVSISTNREVDAQIPNYPSLPPQLICQLHNVVMHADPETDEVYAQMTLQPLSTEEQNRISFLAADLGLRSKQPTNYFCKILTASDTSTHGGFSVPRRAAEKVFPPLDFSQQPPTQELVARDLHDNVWKFKHIFRGQPKRHLLTTGWSVFVTAKRLVAGDSVIFIWNAKNQLFIGIRRANRPQTIMPSSVLSSDSMHLGLLAAAAHAAATNTRFTVFYNPRASPSEFVIPLTKYLKAVHHTRISVGMRFRMLFETNESSVRRYMGTVTGVSDFDPVKWPNSHWRSVKVGWDESAAVEKQPRVSLWEIEALNTFPMYPSSFPLRLRRFSSLSGMKMDDIGLTSSPFWLWEDATHQGMRMGSNPWMQPRIRASDLGFQNDMYQTMATAAAIQEARAVEPPKHMLPSFLQLQKSHALNGQSADFVEPQMSDHFLPSLSVVQSHASVDVFPQQSVHQRPLSFTNTPMQLCQGCNPQPPAIQHFADTCHKVVSSVEPPPSSNYQAEFEATHQSLSHAITCMVDSVSPMESLLGSYSDASSRSLPSYSCRPSKRIAVDPLVSVQQQQQQQHIDQNSVCLPPFPCVDGVGNDPQNNFLFGVNMSSDKVFGTCSSYMSSSTNPGVACSSLNLNPIGSSCIDDSSGFLLSSESTPLGRNNFVKVYKSGPPGRSVDISRLRSYEELHREVGRIFGLEVQQED